MKPLQGYVAVVAGATRGAGRGIALELGSAGATVYCTGRSVRGNLVSGRAETIDETAELVTERGGVGIAVRTDHTVVDEVRALFERIKAEQDGKLDLLVNDVWGGDVLTEWGVPFWEHSLDNGLKLQQQGVHSHIITSYFAAPLMVARRQGLIIEITDGDQPDYRGSFYYDLVKASVIRLALGQAADLEPHNVTALALTPGFLRSEAMLDHFGVTEANWRDATAAEKHFIASETPFFIGRAVVGLACDPDVFAKRGRALNTGDLGREYGFSDVDGRQPHWPDYYATHVLGAES